ncbi:MAG: hypothetical protein K2X06_05845 [Burkholderiales bacterium]|nr:hypothetical protein [Burkholderiales bacterium]
MQNRKPATPCPATLYAAALYLTTRYARSGCPTICRMVMQQLELIANHPDPSVPDDLRETCRKLQADWEHIGAERELVTRKAAVLGAPEPAACSLY